MSKSLRVGVLTGGGDCPGLNAVLRAVTKSLIHQHNAEVIGFEDGFLGLIEGRMRGLSFRDVSGLLTLGGTILGTSNNANPFRYHKRGGADVSLEIVRFCRDLGLDAIVAIGGDGTMAIAQGLQARGVPFVGIPKTIDNDVVGTDRTFGFDTAVGIATEAIDRLHTTAQSHHRVMIVETMGRYAGWIALYAGVAGGADVILIPEIAFSIEEVARVCRERESGGQRFTIIAMAEGARAANEDKLIAHPLEHRTPAASGISKKLEDALQKHVHSQIRTTILGHVQRGGTPSAYDRNLATAFGAYAASLLTHRQFGRMVALQDNRLTSMALEDVAGKTRTVPPEAPMLKAALAVGTSFGEADLDLRFTGTQATAVIS